MANDSTSVAFNGKAVDFRLNVGRLLYGKSNGSDLGDLEKGPISTLFVDPEVLAKTTWDLFRDRFEEAEIKTDTEFFDLLDGEKVREVESAIKKAITDFFSWGPQVIEKIEAKIENLGQAMDQMEQAISGELSGNLQGSQESAPST